MRTALVMKPFLFFKTKTSANLTIFYCNQNTGGKLSEILNTPLCTSTWICNFQMSNGFFSFLPWFLPQLPLPFAFLCNFSYCIVQWKLHYRDVREVEIRLASIQAFPVGRDLWSSLSPTARSLHIIVINMRPPKTALGTETLDVSEDKLIPEKQQQAKTHHPKTW